MTEDQFDTHCGEDELEVTDLRTCREHPGGGQARLPSFSRRPWQRLLLALGLVLLVAVMLAGPLSGRREVPALSRATASPTTTDVFIATGTVSSSLPSTPVGSLPAPTPLPDPFVARTLGPAPADCSAQPPVLSQDGPPFWGRAIGTDPILLGGFIGPYATIPLGPAASTMAYGWSAPYSPYGWPAPIGLILRSGVSGAVTLSGWDIRTGYPLWFGFIVAGEWGAPHQVTPTFTLDPAHPAVPAGGWTNSERFWYGYAFLPGSGCYTLSASWPGGSWRITVSAGVVLTQG
jgi:hypothetical protein